MAGTNPDFDAAAFRQAIKSTWQMAGQTDAQARIYLHSSTPVGNPFNPAVSVSSTSADYVEGQWGVEYFDSSDIQQNPFGMYPPARVVISMFEDEAEEIEDPHYAVVDGQTYYFTGELAPVALFDAQMRRFAFERRTA